nr:MAG TPA: hypothetical protein [Caudoviricetes sp.]
MSTTLEISLIVILVFSIIAFFFTVSVIINRVTYFHEQKMSFRRSRIKIDVREVDNMIDNMIQEGINEFIVINNLAFDNENYIREDVEKEMRKYVSDYVVARTTPVFLEKAHYVYRKESFTSIVANKIIIGVTLYVARNNAK